MDNNKLNFLDDGQSIALTVSHLHNYFQNAYSSFQVKHGQLMNQIRANQAENTTEYQQELEKLSEEVTLFAVLKDALSIADNVLHSSTIIQALGKDSEVFQIHLEDQTEQDKERKIAQKNHPTN